MKKQTIVKDENRISIIPEYGRQRLLMYAESFRDLAEFFEKEEDPEQEEETTEGGLVERQEYLCRRRLQENQELLAGHLKEMSHIMAKVAKETYLYHPVGERRFRKMSKLLKEGGIQLKNFFELESEDGHIEVSLTMRSIGENGAWNRDRECISTDEVADFVSVAMNTRLCASRNAPQYLTREWNTYCFVEEPTYHLLTGVAKAIKETERISGDNYSFCEQEKGKMTALLSDGMGSGEKACQDSERVVELMERLLEAGFQKEAAVQMINGALAAMENEQNMSTLDVGEINLYTGDCDFIKVGAACTYIKRGQLVDRLSSRNLPLGVFQQMEPEVMHRTLQGGDYVIMLSDGILDALSQGIGEEILPEVIGRMDYGNPGEIANQLLGYCIKESKGQIRDDMTVLVIGIWETEQAAG